MYFEHHSCGGETTAEKSRPRGCNPLKRWELSCLSLDKVIGRRRRKNEEDFAKEWEEKSAKERQDYYMVHKVNHNKVGSKRDLQGEHKVQEIS